jgi:uncharacterized protein (TIRG00374 family)
MNKALKNFLRIILFFGFGALLFWLAYRGLDLNTIKVALRGANLWWIAFALFLGIISHISRAIRWQLLLEPLGKKPRLLNTFFAVMIMYIANLALPRLGEVSRCSIITKYEKIPFSKVLGTVVLERFVDMIVLILMFITVIVLQFDKLINFIVYNFEQKFSNFDIHYLYTAALILLVLGLLGIWLLFFKLNHLAISKRIIAFIKSFTEGFITISKMKKKGWFIFHSFFIFFLYYLMIYVNFFAFDFTSHLTPLIGLTVFVMGGLAMIAPVPGGIGAWHFMVYETLAIYGVAVNPSGAAFAFAVHGAMTLMLIVVGAASLFFLPFVNKVEHN